VFVVLGPLHCAQKQSLSGVLTVTQWGGLVGLKPNLNKQQASFIALALLVGS